MAHALIIDCPNCKAKLTRFKIEFTMIENASAFVFEADCPDCKKPVYTCIGTEVFEEWARRESMKLSNWDAAELRHMRIKWED